MLIEQMQLKFIKLQVIHGIIILNDASTVQLQPTGEAEQEGHLPIQFLLSLLRIIIFLHTNMSWL